MTGKIGSMPIVKSKLEETVWKRLNKEYGNNLLYEPDKIKYIQPASNRTYNPDFKIRNHDAYIETKGKLDLATRQKMLWFKECNPDINIIFLFMNPDNKITKRSKTTYSKWATDNGFEWLDFRKDYLSDYKRLCTERGWFM